MQRAVSIVNSFQCELTNFSKTKLSPYNFSSDVSKTILSLSASVERLNFVEQSETINLTLRTLRFGKQVFLVTSSKPACMQMSAIFFVARKKVEKGNFSACNRGNRRCVHPGNIEVAMVGKKKLHNNYLFIF